MFWFSYYAYQISKTLALGCNQPWVAIIFGTRYPNLLNEVLMQTTLPIGELALRANDKFLGH
jgi:hypothetical protein